jgi:FtsH-binding integral membrane protein
MAYLFVLTPVFLNLLAVLLYRGLFRLLAVAFLLPIGFAAACDVYSASKNGNLTGIITICISGPSLIVLILIGVVNVFVRSPRLGRDRSVQHARQQEQP